MPLLKVSPSVDTSTLVPMKSSPVGAEKLAKPWLTNWLQGRQSQLQENISDPDRVKNTNSIRDDVYFNSQPKWDMMNNSKTAPLASDETSAQLGRMNNPYTIGYDKNPGKGIKGYYDRDENVIRTTDSAAKDAIKDPDSMASLMTHELTHKTEAIPQYAKIRGLQEQYEVKHKRGYLQDPSEVYSRLNELRRDMGLKPEDVVTPEMMMKPETNALLNKHQFTKYDPHFTMDLLNKVANNTPSVTHSNTPSITPSTPTAQSGGLLRHFSATVPKTIPSKPKKTIGGTLSAYELKNRRKEELNPNYSHG